MEDSSKARPVILLVDDNPHDAVLTRLAFRRAGIIDAIYLVKDGDEAMDYLSGAGAYADRRLFPMPTLILLDLNMPQTSGFEVLRWVRGKPELQNLFVLVMSSSKEDRDIEAAQQLGASAYLVKPARFAELVGMMNSIKETCLSPESSRCSPAGDRFIPTQLSRDQTNRSFDGKSFYLPAPVP